MKKSKLIQLLSKLDASEMKELGFFLVGKAYKKTGGVFNLYKYLKKHHPKFKESKIEKEVVHRVLFNDSKTFNRRLYDIMSSLTNATEMYLINKKLETDEINKSFLLLDVYKERQLDKLFFKKIGYVEKEWEGTQISGIEHLHNKFKLYQMCFLHPNYSNVGEDKHIDINLLIDKLDQYYFTNKLFLSALVTRIDKLKNLKENNSNFRLLNSIIEHCKEESFQNKQTQFLLELYLILTNESNDISIENIGESFYQNNNLFNQYEKQDIFNFLSHIFFENYRKGKEQYLRNIFDLFKYGSDNNLLLEDGYINDRYFITIVNIGCSLKELNWTNSFINKYEQYLKEENKIDCINLCKSLVLFEEGNFEQVLKSLVQLQFINIIYTISAKSLLLQCYYELEDFDDLFFNLVKSFKSFLKRNKLISEHFKESIYQFINFSNKIYSERLKINRKSLDKLKEELISTQNIAKKKWLISKVNEMTKK